MAKKRVQTKWEKASQVARIAEHRVLKGLANYAERSESLDIIRPSVTNSPDGGHDIDVIGDAKEVKTLISKLTDTPASKYSFLDKGTKNGKLKLRMDVKSGGAIAGDTIDKHASDTTRSPDYNAHLIMMTNPKAQVTPAAQTKLGKFEKAFKKEGVLIDVAPEAGLKRIEKENEKASNDDK